MSPVRKVDWEMRPLDTCPSVTRERRSSAVGSERGGGNREEGGRKEEEGGEAKNAAERTSEFVHFQLLPAVARLLSLLLLLRDYT